MVSSCSIYSRHHAWQLGMTSHEHMETWHETARWDPVLPGRRRDSSFLCRGWSLCECGRSHWWCDAQSPNSKFLISSAGLDGMWWNVGRPTEPWNAACFSYDMMMVDWWFIYRIPLSIACCDILATLRICEFFGHASDQAQSIGLNFAEVGNCSKVHHTINWQNASSGKMITAYHGIARFFW